jgi:hypothetical protein
MGSLAPFKSRLGGFFLPENRVVFLVDGFNVYHSAKVAAADLGGASTLWLDLRSLLSSYISLLVGTLSFLTSITFPRSQDILIRSVRARRRSTRTIWIA